MKHKGKDEKKIKTENRESRKRGNKRNIQKREQNKNVEQK